MLKQLQEEFEKLPEVQAIVLGGSTTTGMADCYSDYDIYIYVSKMPALTIREQILKSLSKTYSLNNQDYGVEDMGSFHNGQRYELMYGTLDELGQHLVNVQSGQAAFGYTTGVWWTLVKSQILYDANGQYAKLQAKYSEYPQSLQQAIIEKNLPMLTTKPANFVNQLEKAIQRQDIISMNHRYSAIVASVADILFALNYHFHPGEKRLGWWIDQLELQPERTAQRLEAITAELYQQPEQALIALRRLISELEVLCLRQCKSRKG